LKENTVSLFVFAVFAGINIFIFRKSDDLHTENKMGNFNDYPQRYNQHLGLSVGGTENALCRIGLFPVPCRAFPRGASADAPQGISRSPVCWEIYQRRRPPLGGMIADKH